MKWLKRILIGIVVLILVAGIGFFAWTRLARYEAVAPIAPVSTQTIASKWLTYEPARPNGDGIIIYPGGLVDAAAYGILAKQFADRGVFAVVLVMPLDLAVFSPNAARDAIAAFPNVKRWAIAGHSLGGSMAAQYLSTQNDPRIIGLAFWASYAPSGVVLSDKSFRVVSIYGSHDQVLRISTDAERLAGLSASTKIVRIEGGNHSMFGNYGQQKGDGTLDVPFADAQRQIVDATMMLYQ